MNTRILTVVSLVSLATMSIGCTSTRNPLFGRGAQCGLCNRLSTAGQALNPFAPAPRIDPGCGHEVAPHAGCPTCPPGLQAGQPFRGPFAQISEPGCGYELGCGHEGVISGYGGYVDPYSGSYYGDGVILPDSFEPRSGEISNGGEAIPTPAP